MVGSMKDEPHHCLLKTALLLLTKVGLYMHNIMDARQNNKNTVMGEDSLQGLMSIIPCPSLKATNSSHLYFLDYICPKQQRTRENQCEMVS